MADRNIPSKTVADEMREHFGPTIDRASMDPHHYDGCWKDHWVCAVARLLDTCDRLEARSSVETPAEDVGQKLYLALARGIIDRILNVDVKIHADDALDIRQRLECLIHERDSLRDTAMVLARRVIQGGNPFRDHGCGRCVPGGEMVDPSFTCSYHLALDYVGNPEQVKTGRDDPLAGVRWICSTCTTVNGIDDEKCLGCRKSREEHDTRPAGTRTPPR